MPARWRLSPCPHAGTPRACGVEGRAGPDHVIGVHVTQLFFFPSGDPAELVGLTEQEVQQLEFLQFFNGNMSGFARLQESAPQNLAHALAGSPAGQRAWTAQLLSATADDHVLTSATIYWLTDTAASSARLYYEDKHAEHPPSPPRSRPGLPASPTTSSRCAAWPSATTRTSCHGTTTTAAATGPPRMP